MNGETTISKSPFLSSVRPINLLLVGLSQFLVYYFACSTIDPLIPDSPIVNRNWNFLIFSIITILVTANGYIINDYFDFEIDRLKAHKKQYSSRVVYIRWYSGLYFCGLVIEYCPMLEHEHWTVSHHIQLASIGLFIYSSHLKSSIMWGNILVSLYTGFVMYILLLFLGPELEQLKPINPYLHEEVYMNIIYLSLLSFISNLIREIAKDIEDMKYDAQYGVITLATRYPINTIKALLWGLIVLLVWTLSAWIAFRKPVWGWASFVQLLILFVLPLFLMIVQTFEAQTEADFKKISQLSKYLMLAGLIYIMMHLWI